MIMTAEPYVKDLDNYYGKPTIIKYILNGEYEIEIQMPINWKEDDLPDVLQKSFIEPPKSIHITSVEIDNKVLN